MRAYILSLTLFSFVMAAGCGKDDPAPAPPAAPLGPAKNAAPEPASGKPKGAEANPTVKAPNVAPVAEKKATPVVGLKPPVPSTAMLVKAEAAAPRAHLNLPDSVTAVIGTPSFARAVTAFTDAVKGFGAATPADPVAAALAQLRSQLGTGDVSWMATDRPLRVAVPDPKAYPEGMLALIPFDGEVAGLKQALALAPAAGHAGKRSAGGRELFVDFHKSHVVLTSHPGLWTKLQPFVDQTLLGWTPRAPLVVELSLTRLRKIYAAEYSVARGFGDAMATQIVKRANIPGQADTIKGALSGVFDFASNTDRLSLAMHPNESDLGLEIAITGVKGTPYASTIATLGGRALALLETIPASAWFAFATNMAPALLTPDEATLVAQLTAPGRNGVQLTKAQATTVAKRIQELVAVSEGPSVMAISSRSGFPFAISSVMAVRDGAVAERSMVDLLEVVWDVMMTGAKARLGESGADLSQLPLGSFSAAIGLLDNVGKNLGVSAKTSMAAEKRPGGNVSVRSARFDFDWTKTKAAFEASPDTYDVLRAMVGERLEMALVRGPQRLAIGLGPDAVAQSSSAAVTVGAATNSLITPDAADSFLVVGLRLGAMLQGLSALPRLAPIRSQLAQLPADEAFRISAGSDGTWLTVRFNVPVALTRGVLNLR
ncbi:MAG: hypothetical protein ACI9MR_002385 [Myxococcota bacterium]|jgi:hypothetical protein